MHGEGGNDILRAGAGDDELHGGSGNDQIVPGTGNDQLEGGPGDDTYVFGEVGNQDESAWGTDTITDAAASNDEDNRNTLDFSGVAANLSVSIDGTDVAVTATEEIDASLPEELSFGSDSDAVELSLSGITLPTVVDFGQPSESVSGGAIAFRMIVGTGRDQVQLANNSVSLQEIRDEVGEEATSTITANVNVNASPLGARVSAGDNSVAYLDSGGFWQQTNELLLRNLLPDPVETSPGVWNVPETTLTLSVGEFRKRTNTEYEASAFDVTLFSEPEWTGFAGTHGDLNAALKSYYRDDLEGLIETASSIDEIAADQDQLNEIAEELWLQKIADQIRSKFSVSGDINAEVVRRESGDVLSISIEGHTGDIAIAPSSVSLPQTLTTSFTQTQSLNGDARVSRFVAPSENSAQVTYDIDSLALDLEISFDGTEAKSTLDVSDIAQEMRVTFTGGGELTVEVLGGATPRTVSAAGIASLVVGNGVKTYVLTEDGGKSQISVTDSSTDNSARHLVLGDGFLEKSVVLNNDTSNTFVIGGDSYDPHALEFEGADLTAPDFGSTTFETVRAEGSFLGQLHVKSVAIVEGGQQNDICLLYTSDAADE